MCDLTEFRADHVDDQISDLPGGYATTIMSTTWPSNNFDYDSFVDSITKLYFSLLRYDEELITDELTDVIQSHTNLVNILQNPSSHISEIRLIATMLNTPQSGVVEKERQQDLEQLLALASMSNFPETSVLLPPSEFDKIYQQLTTFYQKYDPNNFINGWNKDQLKENKCQELFRDLHSIKVSTQSPDEYQNEASNLIDNLRELYDDPVSDIVQVMVARPNKDIGYRAVENTKEALSELYGTNLAYKPLGCGIIAAVDKDGKSAEKPRCRVIQTFDSKKLGIARGNIIFFAIDSKQNIVDMSVEQSAQVKTLYGAAQDLDVKQKPIISDRRAHNVIKNLVQMLILNDYGFDMLRTAGLSTYEIEQYRKLKT